VTDLIYKIVPKKLWDDAVTTGAFNGARIDIEDGYIHFSTGLQLGETVAKHFADKSNLWIVAVNPDRLGDALRFESSRNDDLFPHLYGSLNLDDIEWHHAFTCPLCDVFEQPPPCIH